MQNIITELWNGHLSPMDKSGADDPEIQDLVRLIERNYDKLDEILDEKGKKTLDNFAHCHQEYTDIALEHAFFDGFSVACRLLTAALSCEP